MYYREIIAILKDIVVLDNVNISIDTDLFEEGLMDSLATMNMFIHLEQIFGISIDLAEIEIDDFATVRKINDFVVTTKKK